MRVAYMNMKNSTIIVCKQFNIICKYLHEEEVRNNYEVKRTYQAKFNFNYAKIVRVHIE